MNLLTTATNPSVAHAGPHYTNYRRVWLHKDLGSVCHRPQWLNRGWDSHTAFCAKKGVSPTTNEYQLSLKCQPSLKSKGQIKKSYLQLPVELQVGPVSLDQQSLNRHHLWRWIKAILTLISWWGYPGPHGPKWMTPPSRIKKEIQLRFMFLISNALFHKGFTIRKPCTLVKHWSKEPLNWTIYMFIYGLFHKKGMKNASTWDAMN